MAAISMSATGRQYLKSAEGEVLKAYRCPSGVWTIGVGLTAASGVVTPHAGMTLTPSDSDRLLTLALDRNYEPRVEKAMPAASQPAFDGGTSFDFNTGRIHNAGWVALWRTRAAPARIRASLGQWRKGGGKVLPGLVRRRAEEADIILLGKYPAGLDAPAATPTVAFAAFVISMTESEIAAVREGFATIGFDPGKTAGKVKFAAVTDFQKSHDLTVDGKIGRATLSTLQRELDARKAAVNTGGAAVGGGAVAGGNEAAAPDPSAVDPSAIGDPLVTWLGILVVTGAVVYGLWLAWHYRDMIAVRVQKIAPGLAAWLRSF